MRAVLVSFRLDMARITVSSASGFVPFLLPLLFAVIFGLAGRTAGNGADFATGGVVGSVFGVGTILPIGAFGYEWQEQHARMNGIIPADRTHQVIGRYLTLPVFAAIIVAETTLALVILHLTAYGSLNGLAQALTTSVLGSTWSFVVFELVLFPLFYRWNDMRKALLCVVALLVGLAGLVTMALYAVPEEALDELGDAVARTLSNPGVGIPAGLVVLAVMTAVSLPVSIACRRRKEF
ncbi:ABC-2 transporter permease [Bifidobacterium sp. UBA4282]|uniref:ABC-2 transporter permease n=1 Tax=Bifidobacterium sp. UBA4282 TaxID=1946096 RepID=UPI0025C4D9F5|nr:ABC-2 transporter permease [Bifidobacterium sp. UBA4282]